MALLSTNVLPAQTVPFGPGSGKTGFRHLLRQLEGLQEGVGGFGGLDFKVSQRAAGATMTADIAAGEAFVYGDDTARQGIYHQTNDATINMAVPANASGNPRLDQLILHVYDSSISGASDTPALEVIQGTPGATVTIDNRVGAAALPNNAIRLAEWVAPNGMASLTNAIIRDRRPWARGAYWRNLLAPAADYGLTSTTPTVIDATNLQARLECSGVPVRMMLSGRFTNDTAVKTSFLTPMVDGAASEAQSGLGIIPGAAGYDSPAPGHWTLGGPAAGSHLIAWGAFTETGGAWRLRHGANTPVEMVVEEIVRQNAANTGA